MRKQLEQKLRSLIKNPKPAPLTNTRSGATFVAYFKVFHQQYHALFLLYLGLFLTLGCLLVIVSYLIYSSEKIIGAPMWLPYTLGIVDFLLFTTLAWGITELLRFRHKNQKMLRLVMHRIVHDLQLYQGELLVGHKAYPEDITVTLPQEPVGWDVRQCPSCSKTTDLLDQTCPFCFHPLGSTLQN